MDFDYTRTSNKPIEEVKESLIQALKDKHFGVLFELDLKKTMNNKGVDHQDASYILEVCHPQKAKNLIDINPRATYILPCKVAVYESNGTCFIGFPRPITQVKLIGDVQLLEQATIIEKELTEAVESI